MALHCYNALALKAAQMCNLLEMPATSEHASLLSNGAFQLEFTLFHIVSVLLFVS